MGICSRPGRISMATGVYPAGDISLLRNITHIDYGQLGWGVSRWYRRTPTQVALKECAVPQLVAEVRVSTLGLFRVCVNDVQLQISHDASRKVMLMLALSEDHSWSRETMAGIIWPDASRSKSLANLRQTLLNLRKSLQPICGDESPLQADAKSVSLVNCSISLDTGELLNKIEQHQRIDAISHFASQATDGYSADLKSGSDLFVEWLEFTRKDFLDQLKKVLQEAIESIDSTDIKLQYANFLSTLDPCNELACRAKMIAYQGNGEQGEALKCYAELWKSLEDEYDLEPSNSTQELAVAIKLGESDATDLSTGTKAFSLSAGGAQGDVTSVLETEDNGKQSGEGPDPAYHDAIVPRIAVVPFVGRGVTEEQQVIGEVLADDLINKFSICNTVSVISRLSSSVFSGVTGTQQAIKMLQVQYLMTGSYRVVSDQIILDVEFCCSDTSAILWQKRFKGSFSEFLNEDHPFVEEALHGMGISVMGNELRKTASQPLDQLNDYTLLIGAIAQMHRLTSDSFLRSKSLFESLIERNPRHALPHAYLSMWYVLRVVQGWSDNPGKDGEVAFSLSSTALDLDPFLSLAHTLHGYVNTNLRKDFEVGESCYTTALEYNQSDSLAWLGRGTLYAFQGKGDMAVSDTSRALSISPFDPYRYFYYSLAGTAYMSAEKYQDAIELSQKSLRLNREHASTCRVLCMSFGKIDKHEESEEFAKALLRVQPGFTVSTWLRDTPFEGDIARDLASTLLDAGIPK